MNVRRTAVSVVLASAVAVVGAGTAQALPAPGSPAATAQAIHYRSRLVGHTVVTTVDKGIFVVGRDRRYVSLKDTAGKAVVVLPLTYRLDDRSHNVRTTVSADGHTLKMTPDSTSKPTVAEPIASGAENSAAAADFINTLELGTTAGSLLGLALGVAAGAVVGVLGAGACAVLFSIACAVAALPIVATVATVGGIIGTVAVGGPTLVYAGYNYVQTLMAPPFTTKYWTHK
jgi:hypothetical protein